MIDDDPRDPLVLVAFTPRDGWAIVREGERWWHVQPPYEGRRELTKLVAARAVMEQGFMIWVDRFRNWDDLIRKLNAERDPPERGPL